MGLKIRKAEVSDAALLAWGMLDSSRSGKKRGFFDLVFDTNDTDKILEYLEKLVISDTKSYCHYSNFLIAEVNGANAGILCGYEPRIATEEVFAKALGEIGIDESYQERIQPYAICDTSADKKTWMLDFMDEKPEFDDLGILKHLIQKSLLTARLKGYRKAQTIVEIGSAETQMVYEKLGFEVVAEERCELYSEVFNRLGIKKLQMHL